MKWISLLFVLTTLYFLVFRSHLLKSANQRKYRKRVHLHIDFFYYLIDLFYLPWIITLSFINLTLSLSLVTIFILKWGLKINSIKGDITFGILKILVLLSFFLIG